MSLARVVIVLAFALLATPAIAAPTAAQLAKDRAAAAEKVYTQVVARLASGQTTVEVAYQWSVRWLDSKLLAEPAKSKEAFVEHSKRMQALETERAKARDAGVASTADADSATYFRIEAEYWQLGNKR